MDTDKIADALVAAGSDTIVTVDGTRWRFRFDADEDTRINDFDCYGKIETVRSYDGRSTRPATFDGRARILSREYGWHTWWQPPTDISDSPDHTFRLLRDIWDYGFTRVVVERLADNDDAYGRPVVLEYHGIGGIEPFPDDSDIRYYVWETLDTMSVGV